MLHLLPTELQLRIGYQLKNSDLEALSLVSRSLTHNAQSLRFLSIKFELNNERWTRQRLDGMSKSVHLSNAVQHIKYTDLSASSDVIETDLWLTDLFFDFLSQCSQTRSLSLNYVDISSSALSAINSLSHLKEISVKSCTLKARPHIFLTCPLTSVTLSIGNKSGAYWTEKFLSDLSHTIRLFLPPSVIHLTLRFYRTGHLREDFLTKALSRVWDNLPNLPNLKTLKIDEMIASLHTGAGLTDLVTRYPSHVFRDGYYTDEEGNLPTKHLPNLKYLSGGDDTTIPLILTGSPIAHIRMSEIYENFDGIWRAGKDQLVSVELRDEIDEDLLDGIEKCNKLKALDIRMPWYYFADEWRNLKLPPTLEVLNISFDSVTRMDVVDPAVVLEFSNSLSYLRNLSQLCLLSHRQNFAWRINPQTGVHLPVHEALTIKEWREREIGPVKEPPVWSPYRHAID